MLIVLRQITDISLEYNRNTVSKESIRNTRDQSRRELEVLEEMQVRKHEETAREPKHRAGSRKGGAKSYTLKSKGGFMGAFIENFGRKGGGGGGGRGCAPPAPPP